MAFFKKDKKQDTPTVTPVEEKKDADTPAPSTLDSRVMSAIDNVIPVITNGDLNLIPSVYNSEVLTKSIEEANPEDLAVLADYTHKFIKTDPKGEKGFAGTFLNFIAAGIGEKIKSAEKIYTIYSNILKNPYPLIATGFALVFFNKEHADSWAENYTSNHQSPVFSKELKGEEIKNYFYLLTALGIMNIGVEPGISNIVMNHKPMYNIEFETTTPGSVQYLALRLIQLDKSRIFHTEAPKAHGALLSQIMTSKFLCPGKNVNGQFTVATLSRGKDSIVSVFTDKAELQKNIDETPSAADFLKKSDLAELTFTQLEPFLMLPQVSALTINISGIGFTLRKEIYEKLYQAIKENPGKNVEIKVE